MFKKILIVGHARHGKDTCAEILKDTFDYTFNSSSFVACREVIYPKLKDKYNYTSQEECYKDRINHRSEWYDLICEYNKNDRLKLCKKVLEDSCCYVGMRDLKELLEAKRQSMFDLIIWVDASNRLPLEPNDSFNIGKEHADIIIDNNFSYEEFRIKVIKLGYLLCK